MHRSKQLFLFDHLVSTDQQRPARHSKKDQARPTRSKAHRPDTPPTDPALKLFTGQHLVGEFALPQFLAFFCLPAHRGRDRSGRWPIPAAHPRARPHGHPGGPGPVFARRDAPRPRRQSTPHRAARCAVLRPARSTPPPARRSRAEATQSLVRKGRAASGHRSAKRAAHAIQAGRSDGT